jgi:hypothetical protein
MFCGCGTELVAEAREMMKWLSRCSSSNLAALKMF